MSPLLLLISLVDFCIGMIQLAILVDSESTRKSDHPQFFSNVVAAYRHAQWRNLKLIERKKDHDQQLEPLLEKRNQLLCETGQELKNADIPDKEITVLVLRHFNARDLWAGFPPFDKGGNSKGLSDKTIREILRDGGVLPPAKQKTSSEGTHVR